MEVTFTNPKYLVLLVAIPIFIFIHFYTLTHMRREALKFANFEAIRKVTGGKSVSKNILLLLLRLMIIMFIIFAVTGTVVWYSGLSAKYDMVLAIDASSSMLADDYTPNRLDAAKNAAAFFIDKIEGDVSAGLVAFSGAAFIKQEPTQELRLVRQKISELEILELGGTDIGQAIITSANLLHSSSNPKIIVIMTDGRSNVGIDPLEAIDTIKKENIIIIYTIGIATTTGGAVEGVSAAFTLDEDTLKKIAENTGGKYFHATDIKTLENAFYQISQFQKKKIKLDISLYLLLFAFFLLFVEWGLLSTKYRVV